MEKCELFGKTAGNIRYTATEGIPSRDIETDGSPTYPVTTTSIILPSTPTMQQIKYLVARQGKQIRGDRHWGSKLSERRAERMGCHADSMEGQQNTEGI